MNPQYTTTSLHAHQIQGVQKATHAIKHHCGALIADEMGLGKTIVGMHCFCPKLYLKIQKGKSCKILILAPVSVLIEWKSQLNTHLNRAMFPSNQCHIMYYSMAHGKVLTVGKRKQRLLELFQNRKASFIVLASYGTMRNDASVLLSYKWDYVVMDECQHIKNEQSQAHKMLCDGLSRKTKRIGLSGTPNANHPIQDLCALSKVLFPQLTELHNKEHYIPHKPPVLDSVIVRRTLKDVGIKLPRLLINTISLRFESKSTEWNVYNDQLKKTMVSMYAYIKACKYKQPNRLLLLRAYQCALNMLGKVCTHYQIRNVRNDGLQLLDTETTTKEQYVHRLIADYAICKNKKLIVASASSTFLNIVHAKTEARHTGTSICFTGETRLSDRENVLTQWKHPSGPNVLLLSMKAGGVGLTLIEAHRLICVDGLSQSNPADREQVIKRVHRYGQLHDVIIDDLCIEGTIDEAMKEAVHPSKQRISNALLQNVPVLKSQSSSTQSKSVNLKEMCAIGTVLLPMWKKMDQAKHPSVPQHIVNISSKKRKRHTTVQETQDMPASKPDIITLSKRRIKKKQKNNLKKYVEM